MGRDRGEINFLFEERLEPDEWIELLVKIGLFGWEYRDPVNQSVSITPLGDEVIDWRGVRLTDPELEKLIAQKQSMREPFGIAIRLPNPTAFDDAVLFQKPGVFSVWLGDSAKDIENHQIVDYSHYLPTFVQLVLDFRSSFDLSITAYVDRA